MRPRTGSAPVVYMQLLALALLAGDATVPWGPALADPADGNQPPVAKAGVLEDRGALWTDMTIHFSSNGSYDDEGGIDLAWDFGDGSDPSMLAEPTHVYGDPGTYNVTLTVTDQQGLSAQDGLTLEVQLDYGDDAIVINAMDQNTAGTFRDPPAGGIGTPAVRRGGWVAYRCALRAGHDIVVEIDVIGHRTVDVYLLREAHFQAYRDDPSAESVPFEAKGAKFNLTGLFRYKYLVRERDRYYVVIDNKDRPLGTDTQGPVDYTVSIKRLIDESHGQDYPWDDVCLLVLALAIVPVAMLAMYVLLGRMLKER